MIFCNRLKMYKTHERVLLAIFLFAGFVFWIIPVQLDKSILLAFIFFQSALFGIQLTGIGRLFQSAYLKNLYKVDAKIRNQRVIHTFTDYCMFGWGSYIFSILLILVYLLNSFETSQGKLKLVFHSFTLPYFQLVLDINSFYVALVCATLGINIYITFLVFKILLHALLAQCRVADTGKTPAT